MQRHVLAVVLPFTCAVTLVTTRDPAAAAIPALQPVLTSVVGSATAEQEASVIESSLGPRPARAVPDSADSAGLNNEGFDAGVPDGLFGLRMRTAIRRGQEPRKLPATVLMNVDIVDITDQVMFDKVSRRVPYGRRNVRRQFAGAPRGKTESRSSAGRLTPHRFVIAEFGYVRAGKGVVELSGAHGPRDRCSTAVRTRPVRLSRASDEKGQGG